MTTHAYGVTDADDVSRRVAGATVAGGGIGSPEVLPLAPHGLDVGHDRSRDDDSVTESNRNRDEASDDAVRAARAQRVLLALRSGQDEAPPDIGRERDRRSDNGLLDDVKVSVPGAPAVQMTQAEAFVAVKEARALVDVKLPQESSQADYGRKAEWLWSQVDSCPDLPDGERWCCALEGYVGQPASYRAYKAACCWVLRSELSRRLAEQDRMQRAGDRGDGWLHRVALIQQLAEDLRIVHAHKRVCPVPIEGMTLPGRESKKPDLRRIARNHPDWMARMLLSARRTKYLDPVRLLTIVGCRPEELRAGVEVGWSAPNMFSINIKGAKVDEAAGQPWRRVHFPASLLPHAWRKRLNAEGRFVVRVDSKDGLRKCLQRISSKVLPGAPFATAYVIGTPLPHACATLASAPRRLPPSWVTLWPTLRRSMASRQGGEAKDRSNAQRGCAPRYRARYARWIAAG